MTTPIAQNSILSLASRFPQKNSYLRILRPYKKVEDSIPKYMSKNLYIYVQENKKHSNLHINIIHLKIVKMSITYNNFPIYHFLKPPFLAMSARCLQFPDSHRACIYFHTLSFQRGILSPFDTPFKYSTSSDFMSQHYCCLLLESHHA